MEKYFWVLIALIFYLTINIEAQNNLPFLEKKNTGNWKSDGCTMFPDGDYQNCCLEHDEKYFRGGSWKERWRADNDLRKCVKAKPGFYHKPVSIVMWLGVRAFGVPWLPTKFRWGFGKGVKANMND